jgi:hypothetical protein
MKIKLKILKFFLALVLLRYNLREVFTQQLYGKENQIDSERFW